jgi:HEAT repeat protein
VRTLAFWLCPLLLATTSSPLPATSPPVRSEALRALESKDFEALRDYGESVMPVLVEIYRDGSRDQRVAVAGAWYRLGWRSEEAKEALLEDLTTGDPMLRLQVQYALGRVSADPEVVRRLLVTMRDDPNPLFRDKAACALASDQIHLTAEQRLTELAGLVAALSDEKPQVRRIAIQALRILTGQDKGFRPKAPPEARAAAIERWQIWLVDYRSSV